MLGADQHARGSCDPAGEAPQRTSGSSGSSRNRASARLVRSSWISRLEQGFLAVEIDVERALRHTGDLGDLAHAGAIEPCARNTCRAPSRIWRRLWSCRRPSPERGSSLRFAPGSSVGLRPTPLTEPFGQSDKMTQMSARLQRLERGMAYRESVGPTGRAGYRLADRLHTELRTKAQAERRTRLDRPTGLGGCLRPALRPRPPVRPAAKPKSAGKRLSRRAGARGCRLRRHKGYGWWTDGRFMVSTDDAYVQADITILSREAHGLRGAVEVVEQPEREGRRRDRADRRRRLPAGLQSAQDKLATQESDDCADRPADRGGAGRAWPRREAAGRRGAGRRRRSRTPSSSASSSWPRPTIASQSRMDRGRPADRDRAQAAMRERRGRLCGRAGERRGAAGAAGRGAARRRRVAHRRRPGRARPLLHSSARRSTASSATRRSRSAPM